MYFFFYYCFRSINLWLQTPPSILDRNFACVFFGEDEIVKVLGVSDDANALDAKIGSNEGYTIVVDLLNLNFENTMDDIFTLKRTFFCQCHEI